MKPVAFGELIQKWRDDADETGLAMKAATFLACADELEAAVAALAVEREEIQALLEKASPLPWRIDGDGYIEDSHRRHVASTPQQRPNHRQDARLIVAAVNRLGAQK